MAAVVPDITGTVLVPATFDGSGSTSVDYYHWSWTGVAPGSALVNAPIPFPDSGATTPIDMTDNEGLWHFDSAATDTSGTGNNATLSGTTYVAGKVGTHAVNFSSGDYAEVPNDASLNSATGTVSFWFKTSTSTAGSHAFLVGKHLPLWSLEGWFLYLDNNQLKASIKNNIQTDTLGPTAAALNDNAWHHVAFVFVSGGTSKLFVDGALIDTEPATIAFTPTPLQPLRMAVSVDAFWGNYVGSLDEVALWSRALSDAEVFSIYTAQDGALASLGSSSFTFTPDIAGTYTVNLEVASGASTTADAVISAAGGGPTSQGSDLQGEELQGAKLQGDI